jgi:hypothetical protein
VGAAAIAFAGAGASPGDTTPPDMAFSFEQRIGGYWEPYTPGIWTNAPVVRVIQHCLDAESGVFDAFDARYTYFKGQGQQTFTPAPCEDRAGNINDGSGEPTFGVWMDRQKPVCSFEPATIALDDVGGFLEVQAQFTWSDNLDPGTFKQFDGWTSSDGKGSVQDVAIGPGSETATVTGDVRATKSSLQRVYRLRFEVFDHANNIGTCTLRVTVK